MPKTTEDGRVEGRSRMSKHELFRAIAGRQ